MSDKLYKEIADVMYAHRYAWSLDGWDDEHKIDVYDWRGQKCLAVIVVNKIGDVAGALAAAGL